MKFRTVARALLAIYVIAAGQEILAEQRRCRDVYACCHAPCRQMTGREGFAWLDTGNCQCHCEDGGGEVGTWPCGSPE